MNKYSLQNKKGFTLIELMVSVSIFAIVMTISLGAILTILDTSKKAQSLKSVMSNLNFAMENMSRNIKTSRSFTVTNTCEYDGTNSPELQYTSNALVLVDSNGNQVTYELVEDKVVITDDSKNFDRTPITAEEIRVEYLCFYVAGASESDSLQPKVTMIIKGVSGTSVKTQSEFQLQTTVSKRVIQS